MSALAEFLCVAIALFVWESLLWLPLRGTALRKRWFGGTWKVLDPEALFATRELGVIPMLIPPDAGLAPCQGRPWPSMEQIVAFLWNTVPDGFSIISH